MLRKISSIILTISLIQFSLPYPAAAENAPELKKIPLQEENEEKDKNYVEGEIIVKYKSKKKQKAALKEISSFSEKEKKEKDIEIKDEIGDLSIAVLKSEKKSTQDLIEELKKDDTVDFAEPNYKRELTYIPNDTYFSSQWAIRNTGQSVGGDSGANDADIDGSEMWDAEESGAADTIVAVIDNGVEYDNPDLDANMWDGSAGCKSDTNANIPGGCPYHGWDYKNNDSDPRSDPENVSSFYHGTFISSIIGSETNNARGIAGISRYGHNKVMAVKFGMDVASEIKSINFAKNNGAKVINASFVGTSFSQSEKNAIDSFPGIFVAASGNLGKDVGVTPYYPCAYTSSNVICVGSSDQDDGLSSFSNYNASGVDIAAPGDNVAGLVNDNNYASAYGTSFSAPHVAGTVGVLYSQDPSASISTVRDTLLKSSDHKSSLSGKIACGRRLNANAALTNMKASLIPDEICTYPIYRFWSDKKQGHFYTISEDEKNTVIQDYDDATWKFEEMAFLAYTNQFPNTTPIYRFWSDTKQHHFYTASAAEKDSVIATYPSEVWKYEGIAYYTYASQQANTTPIYRFWSDTKQGHFYTSSAAERDFVIATYPSEVWKYEGISWYVPTS